jgi:hypothetical protein
MRSRQLPVRFLFKFANHYRLTCVAGFTLELNDRRVRGFCSANHLSPQKQNNSRPDQD